MESLSLASFTLASILSSLPAANMETSQAKITTHISPAIAGQWEVDLQDAQNKAQEKSDELSKSKNNAKTNAKNNPPLTQSPQVKTNTQCRELYNFAADNEVWTVSGKERTYGRYLVTHRDEGLPIIALQTVYDNNEPDCSGNQIDQSGEAFVAFVQHEGNKMQWCADDKGAECFMSFHRVLP